MSCNFCDSIKSKNYYSKNCLFYEENNKMQQVTVQTNANVALIKYWGKRNEQLFLPTKTSLSVALSGLTTTTTIRNTLEKHDLISFISGISESSHKKIIDFIDFFRARYSIKQFFAVTTHNNFPTAAGLASSASGFAALALALNAQCKLNLSEQELSVLARYGSGSACRSIYGGFVVWHKGEKQDGSDSYAEQLFDHNHWPELRILVIVVKNDEKKISSRNGMRITTNTSPSYKNWLSHSEQRVILIIKAIEKKDFELVGTLAQADWTGMQQTMLDAQPQLDYWTTVSHDVMHAVKQLRATGVSCYFTTDAGPNVKLICLDKDIPIITRTIKTIRGVLDTIECTIGQAPIINT